MSRAPLVLLVVCAALAASCTTYRDELARGQQAFDNNEHERALAILDDLEPDVTRLGPTERARYSYLRGMSNYRTGHKREARHWLVVALAQEEMAPGSLPVDWKTRSTEALAELNEVVYADGLGALAR